MANGGNGIIVDASASANIIGGTTVAARDIISGNTSSGVEIDGGGADVQTGLTDSYTGNGTLNNSVTGTPGTAQGTITYAPGPIAGTQAFHLDGNTSGVAFGPRILGTSDFTISLWLQTTVQSSNEQLVLSNRNSYAGSNFFNIKIKHGIVRLEVDEDAVNTNYIEAHGETIVNDGRYHQITMVRQGTTLSLYVDGALDAQGTGSGVANLTSNLDVSIGADPYGYSNVNALQPFGGQIGQVKFFSRALGANDIATLASPTGIVGGNQILGDYIGRTGLRSRAGRSATRSAGRRWAG